MSPDLPGDWFHGLVGDLYFPGNWRVSLPEKSKRRHVPQDSWEPRRVAHSCGPNEAEATVVNGKSAWGTYCPPLHLKTQQNRNWVGPQGLASLSTPSLAPCCLPFLPQNSRRLASGQTQTEFSLLSVLSLLWLILEIWSWPLTFPSPAFAPFWFLLLFLICWMSFVCQVSFPIVVGIFVLFYFVLRQVFNSPGCLLQGELNSCFSCFLTFNVLKPQAYTTAPTCLVFKVFFCSAGMNPEPCPC